MATRTRGLRELRLDLQDLPERAAKELPKVVAKGAQHIKTAWRSRWEAIKHAPTHLPHLVAGVGYDTGAQPPRWSAEVGVHARNRQASLAHLIEFGSVRNPPHPAGQRSLDEEAPRFADAVGEAGVRLLE